MSYPTYYISSSITAVDTRTHSKIIMLPPALETLEVRPLMILDRTGNASISSIFLSTQINTFMDNRLSTIVMSNNFQCLSLIPYSTTRYAITTNYTQGLSPFLFSINVNASYTTLPIASIDPMYGSAISSDGTVSMFVSLASENEGIWLSTDSGVTYTKSYSITSGTNFADGCMSADGTKLYACDRLGNVYYSLDTGTTWNTVEPELPGGGYFVFNYIACSSDGTTIVMSSIDNFVVVGQVIDNRGEISITFTVAYDPTTGGYFIVAITSLAISGDGQTIYLGLNSLYGTPPNILVGTFTSDGRGGGSWTFIPGATDGPTIRQWDGMTCSSNGMIAYAAVTDFLDSNYELWKSTNKGVTWTQLEGDSTQIGPQISCDDTGTILFIVSNTRGALVSFSLNGGTSFTQITPPIFLLPGPGGLPTLSCSRNGSYFIATSDINVYRGQLSLS